MSTIQSKRIIIKGDHMTVNQENYRNSPTKNPNTGIIEHGFKIPVII